MGQASRWQCVTLLDFTSNLHIQTGFIVTRQDGFDCFVHAAVADRAGVLEESSGEVLGFMAGHTLYYD